MSYVCDPTGYREPVVGSSGFAARKPETVPEIFKNAKDKFGTRPAMAVKRAPKLVSAVLWIAWWSSSRSTIVTRGPNDAAVDLLWRECFLNDRRIFWISSNFFFFPNLIDYATRSLITTSFELIG